MFFSEINGEKDKNNKKYFIHEIDRRPIKWELRNQRP